MFACLFSSVSFLRLFLCRSSEFSWVKFVGGLSCGQASVIDGIIDLMKCICWRSRLQRQTRQRGRVGEERPRRHRELAFHLRPGFAGAPRISQTLLVYPRFCGVDQGAGHSLCWVLLKSKEKKLKYEIVTAKVFPLSVVTLTLRKGYGKPFLLLESTSIFQHLGPEHNARHCRRLHIR